MNFQKIYAVSFIAVGMPILSFGIVDFVRGAGMFITPYLIGGFFLATISPSVSLSLLLFGKKAEPTGLLKIALFTLLAVLVYFPIAGGSQVLAESYAAAIWEKSGEPLGDHGSYREFYPGDSGMAHYATPWHFLSSWGMLAGIFWFPVLLVGLGLSELLERLVRAIPIRIWRAS